MSDWIATIDQLPESGVSVLVVVNPHANKCRAIAVACFVSKFTLSADDYSEDAGDEDYDEATDRYYTPEGWYEVTQTGEYNMRFDGPVSFWMPLPEKPEEADAP